MKTHYKVLFLASYLASFSLLCSLACRRCGAGREKSASAAREGASSKKRARAAQMEVHSCLVPHCAEKCHSRSEAVMVCAPLTGFSRVCVTLWQPTRGDAELSKKSPQDPIRRPGSKACVLIQGVLYSSLSLDAKREQTRRQPRRSRTPTPCCPLSKRGPPSQASVQWQLRQNHICIPLTRFNVTQFVFHEQNDFPLEEEAG